MSNNNFKGKRIKKWIYKQPIKFFKAAQLDQSSAKCIFKPMQHYIHNRTVKILNK